MARLAGALTRPCSGPAGICLGQAFRRLRVSRPASGGPPVARGPLMGRSLGLRHRGNVRNESPPFSPILGALSGASFAVCLWFAFRAGTVGDVKAVSCGDPAAALALENTAAPFFIVAIVVALAFITSLRRVTVGRRIAAAAVFVLVGGPLLWLTVVSVESWGLRWCR